MSYSRREVYIDIVLRLLGLRQLIRQVWVTKKRDRETRTHISWMSRVGKGGTVGTMYYRKQTAVECTLKLKLERFEDDTVYISVGSRVRPLALLRREQ